MTIIVTMMSEMDMLSAGNDQLVSNFSCVKLDYKKAADREQPFMCQTWPP